MKKKSFLFIFTSLIVLASFVNAKDINSTVIIKPEINYDENIKYEKAEEHSIPVIIEKKKYDLGFDLDINKEERTINYWKVDIKTNF